MTASSTHQCHRCKECAKNYPTIYDLRRHIRSSHAQFSKEVSSFTRPISPLQLPGGWRKLKARQKGLDTSFFLAPSGHRFTSINLAQNFANVLLKKEKVAKAIKEVEAKIKHKMNTRAGKRKAEEDYCIYIFISVQPQYYQSTVRLGWIRSHFLPISFFYQRNKSYNAGMITALTNRLG